MTEIQIRIDEGPFDPWVEQDLMRRGRAQVGALVAFVGLMRDINAGAGVSTMTLEHYPGMTERALQRIAEEASRRWALEGIRIIHRVGKMLPEDPIVLVAVTSRHRGDAFSGCELIIDYLKTEAPFWKKEQTTAGDRWVDARETDGTAAERWKTPSAQRTEEPATPEDRPNE